MKKPDGNTAKLAQLKLAMKKLAGKRSPELEKLRAEQSARLKKDRAH